MLENEIKYKSARNLVSILSTLWKTIEKGML